MVGSGTFSDGIASRFFNFKGVLRTEPLTSDQTLETALEHAIEAGAEDVLSKLSGFPSFVQRCYLWLVAVVTIALPSWSQFVYTYSDRFFVFSYSSV